MYNLEVTSKALQLEKQREREMKKAREDMYEEKNKVFKKNISHEWLFRWQRCTRRRRRDWKGQSSV